VVTPSEARNVGAGAPVLTGGSLFAGDFRIIRQLSSGGMGTVYLAEQASTGKERALKVMHPQLIADAPLRERFEREARIVSLIESDHVVQVIGAGVDAASASPWLAMELLEGEELEAFMARQGKISPAELFEIFRQLCHALGAAHSVGVVHRDLKPENIFVTVALDVEMSTRVKVLDFGIAKVLADAGHSTATLGTPLWMAPEQTDPRANIRASADVWSLGLLAFWMLTGKMFWACVHHPMVSMQAMMRELLFEPIPKASVRAAELGCADDLPPGFDEWFELCVCREPEERLADAHAALAGLRAALPQVSAAPIPFDFSQRVAARTMRPLVTGRLTQPGDPAPLTPLLSGIAAKRRVPVSALFGGLGLLIVLVSAAALATGYVRVGAPSPVSGPSDAPAPVVVPVVPPISVVSASPDELIDSSQVPIEVVPSASAGPRTSVRAKKGAFSVGAAHESMRQATLNAKAHCGHREGPRVISATVFFRPDNGGAQSVSVNPAQAATATALCVSMLLGNARVAPFEGKFPVSATTTVGID